MDKTEIIKIFFKSIPYGRPLFNFLYTNYCKIRNKKRTIISQKPFSLFNIELTNRCPMKCVMCPRTHAMTRSLGNMDFNVFKKAIDELEEINQNFKDSNRLWLHHFGESLVHKEFAKFISYASNKGYKTCLSINPYVLNKERAKDLLNSNIYLLYLSLDGHDDESFYKFRGVKNAYELSKQNILQLLDLKLKNNSAVRVMLSMIDFYDNKDSIKKVKNYWENKAGIEKFLLKSFETWTGDIKEINELKHEENKSVKKGNTIICNLPFEKMTILWDGTVVPCCFDFNGRYKLGNIKEKTLKEIWNDKPMQELRNEFISGNVKNSLCRNCEFLYSASQKL